MASELFGVMLDGKEVLITSKGRRDHMAMLPTSQAMHECAKLVDMSIGDRSMCSYAMLMQQFYFVDMSCKKRGYGLCKRDALNRRIAQWKVSGKRFGGGCHTSRYAAEAYRDAQNKSDVMTWNVTCAKHCKQPLPMYVLLCL